MAFNLAYFPLAVRIIKGTLRLPDGKILAYGNAGVWKTDSCFATFADFNRGLAEGIDNRKISNIVRVANNDIWCAGLYSIYLLNHDSWKEYPIAGNDERISDITQRGDTLVILTRSYLYTSVSPYDEFRKTELKTPENYSPKTSLFRRMNGGRRVYMIPVELRTINTTPRKSTASLPGVPNNSPLCSSQMVRNKEVLGE